MANAERNRALMALAVGVSAISFAAIFIKKAAPTDAFVIAGVRLSIAALLLAPAVYRGWRAGRLPAATLRKALLGGVLYAVHFGAWIESLELTSVAASVTLVTSTPLLLASFALVTGKDRPEPRHWVAIAMAVVGVAIISGYDLLVPSGARAVVGDLLALGGAAAMAGYLLVVRSLGEDLDPWAFMGVACAVGALCLLGGGAAVGVELVVPSGQAFFFIVLSALVPQLVGHGALTWSLRYLPPTMVGMATVVEPVGSTLLAWLWLGEVVAPTTALGAAVTISAVLLAASRGPRKDEVTESG